MSVLWLRRGILPSSFVGINISRAQDSAVYVVGRYVGEKAPEEYSRRPSSLSILGGCLIAPPSSSVDMSVKRLQGSAAVGLRHYQRGAPPSLVNIILVKASSQRRAPPSSFDSILVRRP